MRIFTFKGYNLHWSPEFLCCWQMESAVPVSRVLCVLVALPIEQATSELLSLHKRSSLSTLGEDEREWKSKKVSKPSAD